MAPLAHVADPMERLTAMGRVYLEFAEQNPGLYDLMFIMKAPVQSLEEKHHLWEEGDRVFQVLKATVEEAMKKKLLRKSDVEITSFLVWSTVHGMAALLVTHDVEFAALLADRVLLLGRGEVVASGPIATLGDSPLFAPQIARLFPGSGWLTADDALRGLGRE